MWDDYFLFKKGFKDRFAFAKRNAKDAYFVEEDHLLLVTKMVLEILEIAK
jgi:hypothetical protein